MISRLIAGAVERLTFRRVRFLWTKDGPVDLSTVWTPCTYYFKMGGWVHIDGRLRWLRRAWRNERERRARVGRMRRAGMGDLSVLIIGVVLTLACRPVRASDPPRVPDDDGGPTQSVTTPWGDVSIRRGIVASMRRTSRERRRRSGPPRVPDDVAIHRTTFGPDLDSGAVRVPDDRPPVYASPQSPPTTAGVIRPGVPVTVAVPFGGGQSATMNPAYVAPPPVVYQAPPIYEAAPIYTATSYQAAPVYASAPIYPVATARRGPFGGVFRGFRSRGGSCRVNADGSVSCP
jgi:hypothetical protein